MVIFKMLMLIWLVFLPACACAELSAEMLPSCFAYVTYGANAVYSDTEVRVYAQATGSETVGTLCPGHELIVEKIDPAYDRILVSFSDDASTHLTRSGWIESRYLTFFGFDQDNAYVVITDRPGDRLNLRRKPDSSSVSLGKYYAGAIVLKLEEPKGGYMKVRSAHMEGYMDVRYLQKGMYCDHSELPVLTVVNHNGTGANLRKRPERNSEIIHTAPNGAYVTVLAVRHDDWLQIMYENEIGYTRADLLSPKLNYH